jgi:hypothetical protein
MKTPEGEDWELGHGSFGRVVAGLRGGVQPVAVGALAAIPTALSHVSWCLDERGVCSLLTGSMHLAATPASAGRQAPGRTKRSYCVCKLGDTL